jgi:hypothetical protein
MCGMDVCMRLCMYVCMYICICTTHCIYSIQVCVYVNTCVCMQVYNVYAHKSKLTEQITTQLPVCMYVPLQSSPLQSSPLQSSPLQSSPLQSSPLQSSPLQSSSYTLRGLYTRLLGLHSWREKRIPTYTLTNNHVYVGEYNH